MTSDELLEKVARAMCTVDIVDRLREFSRWLIEHDVDMSLPDGFIDPAEAADEIERLRSAIIDANDDLVSGRIYEASETLQAEIDRIVQKMLEKHQ